MIFEIISGFQFIFVCRYESDIYCVYYKHSKRRIQLKVYLFYRNFLASYDVDTYDTSNVSFVDTIELPLSI